MKRQVDERDIAYREKIVNANAFIYAKRYTSDTRGVLIFTKSTHAGCNIFSCVDRMRGLMDLTPKHQLIADKNISCQMFDELMTFVIQKGVLHIPSQDNTGSPSHFHYILGVKAQDGSENWYSVFGGWHSSPEHQEIIDTILARDEGEQLLRLVSNPWHEND